MKQKMVILKKWICPVCGYVTPESALFVELEKAPDCPQCGIKDKPEPDEKPKKKKG